MICGAVQRLAPQLSQPPAVNIYNNVGLKRMYASAFPRGDCVQPRPSFTVASSKVTLFRCDWIMFTR